MIDWAIFADWYERDLHWRGWIPTGAIGGHIIPRPSASMLPRDPMLKPLRGQDVLPTATVQAMEKLNALRTALLTLCQDIKVLNIPIPDELDLSLLHRLYRRSECLLKDLCRSCYRMLDLVGFFRWAVCIFTRELHSEDDAGRIVAETYEWLDDNFKGKSIGYLIHLDAHHREFGFRLCMNERIPFYYPWLDTFTTMPWLRRFDPNVLCLNPDKPEPPPTDFRPYDQYLQNVLNLKNRTVEIPGLPRRTHYVVDFDGWARRWVRAGERPSRMSKECYWEDIIIGGGSGCVRIHHLWRKKQLDSREYTPFPPDIIRERYKFKFAPCEGDVYDTVTYKWSRDCRRSQIRPNQPFGATPRPSKAPAQTPNPLDSATSSKKSVVPVEPTHAPISVPM